MATEPVDQLAHFPILQYALAVVITIAGAFAAWRGIMGKSGGDIAPPPTAGPAVQWFLDGPVGRALGTLDGLYREIKQLREDQQRYANESNRKHDEETALLRAVLKSHEDESDLLKEIKEKLEYLTRRGHSTRRS